MLTITLIMILSLCLSACGTSQYIDMEPAKTTEFSIEIETSSESPAVTGTEGGEETTADVPEQGKAAAIEQIISGIDWEREQVIWKTFQKQLDDAGIIYKGICNWSGERLDVELEDGSKLLFLQTGDPENQPVEYELIMYDGKFNDEGFWKNYLHRSDESADEPYYPETMNNIISGNNLWKLNQTDLAIARNEIYARHGRKFTDPFFQAVFDRKSWYEPNYTAEEFAALEEGLLTAGDKENLSILIESETSRSFRQTQTEYGRPEKLISGSWVDLDGDGKKEQIVYENHISEPYGEETYDLWVDGQNQQGGGDSLYSQFFTVNMDAQTKVILVAEAGASNDHNMDVYVYRDGSLTAAGLVMGSPESMQVLDGSFYTFSQYDHFQTRHAKRWYGLKGNMVEELARDFYEHGNEVTALQRIPLYGEKNGTETAFYLEKGQKAEVLGGDNKEWISFRKIETGEVGWLKVLMPYHCLLPDGTQVDSLELFDGVTFWG